MDEQLNQQANGTGENSTDREAQYKALQSWFTKQAQELKALREAQEQWQQLDQNGEERKEWIKQNVLEPELAKLRSSMWAEQHFTQLMEANPALKPYERAIKDIADTKWIAYEDVIQDYWFGSKDKLSKAKDRSLVWDRTLDNQPKSIKDLSESEWNDLQKQYKNTGDFSSVDSFS